VTTTNAALSAKPRVDTEHATCIGEPSARYSAVLEPIELPLGYQATDAGVIPCDWSCARLGEGDIVSRVGSGITPTGGQKVYKASGRPFVRSQNVGWGHLLLDDMAYIDDGTHETFPGSEIVEGDVLLNITGASIGRCAVATKEVAEGNVNQHVCEIRVQPKRLNARFLCSFILSDRGQRQIESFQAGGNRQGLNFGQIRSFLLPVPAISEQCFIAEALSDVDGLLGALDALIAKKHAIKQAAMQQLLTGKTRLPSFSDAWEKKQLGNLVTFLSGGTPSRSNASFWTGEIPWISATSLRTFYIWRSDTSLTKEAVAAGSKMAPVGATLLLVRGSALHNEILAGLVTKPVCFNQDVKALVPIPSVFPKFLTFLLHGKAGELLKRVTSAGNTAGVLDTGILRAFEVWLPERPEQEAISALLTDIDAEITALEARRSKTRAIKQGMMQQLLTGRVRLVQPTMSTPEVATP